MNILRRLAALAMALALFACFGEETRVAGGGGVEVEGITVEGMAYFPDDKPVSGARVRLRPWDYLQAPTVPKSGVAAKDRADTVTDAAGRFTVDSLLPGVYSIQVDAGESGQALMKVEADGSRAVVQVEGTVWAGGTVSGRVFAAGGSPVDGARVGLYGLDRVATTDSAGAFLMDGLAPGVYTFKVSPPGDTLSTIDIPEVAVGAGSKVVLDSLVLPGRAPGLRAHWRFDEGAGKVAADAAGSEARFILYGARWAASGEGHALDLGDGAYAAVPRTKSGGLGIGAGTDFMITLRFKADPAAGAGSLRILADTRTRYASFGWGLALDSGGHARFLVRPERDASVPGAAPEVTVTGGSRLDDGNWHHLAAGREGGRHVLYVDGVLAAEARSPAGLLTADNAIHLGALEGTSDFFTGLLDDLRLYERALTAAEAETLGRP